MISAKNLQKIAFFATILGIIVVILGAYTRLDDAGLGCPDWPGCYGKLLGVPNSAQEIATANANFPGATPVQESNPWPEMIHRYVAGTLGLIVFGLCALAWLSPEQPHKKFRKIASFLALLIIMQATLGMWTVTWLLVPWVVMSHLLGGMTITSLLWWQTLSSKFAYLPKTSIKLAPKVAFIGLILVFLQISLGGWTAANYAALICPDFPFCRGSLAPSMDLIQGFSLSHPIGINYEGGVLAEKARIAIQMTHRYGAFIVTAYLCGMIAYLWRACNSKYIKPALIAISAILILQLSLGILNIVWLLPISIAVLHNGVGLMLLLASATVYFFSKKQDV